jgi:hypothetical protein
MAPPFRETLKSSLAGLSLRSSGRAFVLCLSFANLCFLSTWSKMQDQDNDFFRASTATWTQLAAVALDVLILAVVLWVLVILVLQSGKLMLLRVLKWGILASLMIPFNTIRRDPFIIRSGEMLQTGKGHIALGLVGVALALFLLIRWEKLSQRVVSVILTVLLPTFPLVVARTAWMVHSGSSGVLANKPLLPALPQKPGAPHVLWILFDEWDQSLTFDARPANLQLPELDRFRGQSFHAERAYPPAHYTIVSVPSLISGKTFVGARREGASELLLTYDSRRPPEYLTAESTIFREARGAGFNVGIAGWYLPYSRLFGESTTGPPAGDDDAGLSLLGLMWDNARDRFSDISLLTHLGLAERASVAFVMDRLNTYQQLRRNALQSVRDPCLNLYFLHLNVPHPPFIYDSVKASFSTGRETTYMDNLALVDRTLAEIRQTMEQAGTWETTTILLSSDHPLRLGLWHLSNQFHGQTFNLRQGMRVPFLLKMAGEKEGMEYPHAMQTVVSKDLLLAILAQKVTTAAQVGVWLDTHPPRQ